MNFHRLLRTASASPCFSTPPPSRGANPKPRTTTPHAAAQPPPRPALSRRALLLLAIALPPLRSLAAAEPVEPALPKTDAEWRARLSTPAYRVLRQAGTERPFSSSLYTESRAGTYGCAGCHAPLFDAGAKFDSGTGWPSFSAALPAVERRPQIRDAMLSRTEVVCRVCDGHLGHVFRDGPPPSRLRFCINGVALEFTPRNTQDTA